MEQSWSKYKCTNYIKDVGRLIIADDRLFFADVCYDYYPRHSSIISIFEMKIEDRLLIPITKITWPNENGSFPHKFIYGLRNKITIMSNKTNIGITFDVSTNEQHKFRHNDFGESNSFGIYPFKYTLLSP